MASGPQSRGRRQALHHGAGALAAWLGGAAAGAAGAADAGPGPGPGFWHGTPRGFNIGVLRSTRHDREFLEALAATGARVGRLFVDFVWVAERQRYLLPRETLRAVPEVLQLAASLDLKLVLVGDFETAPNPPLWGDAVRAAAFVDAWHGLARLCGGAPSLAGLDLLNEPNPPWSDGTVGAAQREWRALSTRAVQAVRAADRHVPVVLESIGGGQSVGFADMQPLADRNVVYSLHFYSPHPITHQQVSAHWPAVIPYPVSDDALLQGTPAHPGPWNAARLRQSMAEARAFQLRHRVPVYVGEFSCVRWAPDGSALRWLNDSLALFDEYGWSWTYHEFRGWPGWDAEVVAEDRASQQRLPDAPAMKLLRAALARRA